MKISVLLAALLLLFSCTDKDSKQSQDLIVKTAQAVSASGIKTTEFPFIAQPFRTSELSFRVGGPIDRLDVYAGNHYKQGSIIAEIDPRDFHIRKERAEAIYHQAKAEFERIEKLYEKNNVSASTYEKTKADYTTAKTAFDTASNELGDTRLTAPFDGYVGEVYIEKYQDVKPAQPVISFIDINRLKIEIYVTQNIAFASHPTQTALCYRPSEGEYVWVIDTNTRQVNRRTVKKGNLLPGGYVTITEGLRASETVATSGLRFLSDGMKVEISTKTNSL